MELTETGGLEAPTLAERDIGTGRGVLQLLGTKSGIQTNQMDPLPQTAFRYRMLGASRGTMNHVPASCISFVKKSERNQIEI